MRFRPHHAETVLLLAVMALLAVALFAPALRQPAGYHHFADQRALLGVPFAMDVLSNLPFALMGLAGGWSLGTLPAGAIGRVERAAAALFFAGLVITAGASSAYHWGPDDAGLAMDRFGMVFPFAGLLGLAAATRVSPRAGTALGVAMLVLAPSSIVEWLGSGNVTPWAVAQFGGMALVAGLAVLRPLDGALSIRWGWVIAAYAAAKLLEAGDHLIFELTGQLVSGHTLKHAVAALAAWPVITAIRARGEHRQNAATGRVPRRADALRARGV